MKRNVLLIIGLVFLFTNISYSQVEEDIAIDRLGQTRTPLTMPKGYIQAELGITHEVLKFKNTYGFTGTVKTLSAPSIMLRYGIFKNVELRLGGKYITERLRWDLQTIFQESSTNSTSGISNISLGTKINLFDKRETRPDAAFLFHLNIPLNTEYYFQSRYIGTDFRFSVVHSLGSRFSLSYNLGGEWDGNSPQATGIYTLSFGISIVKNFSGFVESYGFLTQGETPDQRVDGGLTYLFAKNIQADIFGGVGITDKSPDFFMGAGISFRFPE